MYALTSARAATLATRTSSCPRIHSGAAHLRGPRAAICRNVMRRAAEAAQVARDEDEVRYEHLLVAIVDANPYLSGGSKQALSTASLLSKQHSGRVTVLLVDDHKPPAEQEHQVMRDTVSWHLREHGCSTFDVIERMPDSTPPSCLVGDLADEVGADLVLLSSEAVHGKKLDANLLAEFVPCPLLLLP